VFSDVPAYLSVQPSRQTNQDGWLVGFLTCNQTCPLPFLL
jgi:hypothetical protein